MSHKYTYWVGNSIRYTSDEEEHFLVTIQKNNGHIAIAGTGIYSNCLNEFAVNTLHKIRKKLRKKSIKQNSIPIYFTIIDTNKKIMSQNVKYAHGNKNYWKIIKQYASQTVIQ